MALNSFGGEGFDPTVLPGQVTGTIAGALYDFMCLLDINNNAVPDALDKYEIAADGLSWTFYLHKGIKFTNGDDLTGADIKFTLERYALPTAQNPEVRNAFDHADLIDPYTIKVYTKGVRPYMPFYVTSTTSRQGAIVPKNYYEKNGADYFLFHPVGSGAYKYVSYVTGDSVNYAANDNWWKGPPAFKTM
jgi:peptide/nickel transport system substrate-binding protein